MIKFNFLYVKPGIQMGYCTFVIVQQVLDMTQDQIDAIMQSMYNVRKKHQHYLFLFFDYALLDKINYLL
jgi:hypothetical protein